MALTDHAGHTASHEASDAASIHVLIRLADDPVGVEMLILWQVEKPHDFTRHIDTGLAVGVFVVVLPFTKGFLITDWHWQFPFVWVYGCVSGWVSTWQTHPAI